MSKAEWGVKRRCASCDAPFYDMQRDPIRCPKCDAVFVVAAIASGPARAARKSRSMRPYVAASFGTAVAEPERRDWAPGSHAAADETEEADAETAADQDDEVEVEADEDDAVVEPDEIEEAAEDDGAKAKA